MLIIYSPDKELPPRRGFMALDGVRFLPGRNNISDRQKQILEKHPDFKRLVELGALIILESGEQIAAKEENPTMLLNPLKVDDAIALVRKTFDINLLKVWQEKEGEGKARKFILNAIAAQLKDIENGAL